MGEGARGRKTLQNLLNEKTNKKTSLWEVSLSLVLDSVLCFRLRSFPHAPLLLIPHAQMNITFRDIRHSSHPVSHSSHP